MTLQTDQFIQAKAFGEDPEYNSHGHRCKEIEDVDLDNYVLFAGCSHTEGVGVTIEDSYPGQVAKELDCDYYNLSVGGGGIDAVEHNLLMWFLLHDKPPKYVFCEWPPHSRYMCKIPRQKNLCPVGPWDDVISKFIVTAEYPLVVKEDLVYKLIHSVSPSPVIDIRCSSLEIIGNNPYTLWHEKEDVGTDGHHYGPLSHTNTTKKIIEHLNIR